MVKIIDAIKAINPNAEVSIGGNSVDSIQWLNGTTEISKSDIEAKQTELETAYDNNKYQRDRAISYKELKEQFDLLYHDMAADKGDKTGEWFKHIKAVKDANLKE
tara:strand:+ start:627 stop:941 length:315 start_codon:yes stop_codon:yes gene_type:complete